jgi:hypothetical protein
MNIYKPRSEASGKTYPAETWVSNVQHPWSWENIALLLKTELWSALEWCPQQIRAHMSLVQWGILKICKVCSDDLKSYCWSLIVYLPLSCFIILMWLSCLSNYTYDTWPKL